mgnify:CR=1 FL=1
MRCPFCGSHLDNDAKYCNDCGTAVDSECKGKNINYRSYNDTRPNASSIPKAAPYTVRQNNTKENPFVDKNRQYASPPVSNLPSAAYAASNVNKRAVKTNTKKKSGCGVVAVIVAIIIFFFPAFVLLFDKISDSVETDSGNKNSYYEQEWGNNDENEYSFTDDIYGRFDGAYYLNDYANFAFEVPDGFEEQSLFSYDYDVDIISDLYFENEDGDYILTGYFEGDDAKEFLNEYINSAQDYLSDLQLDTEISDAKEKQVYNYEFITQSVSCDDGRIVDVYACPVNDYVFFIEINTYSNELNNRIADTFVNSYNN